MQSPYVSLPMGLSPVTTPTALDPELQQEVQWKSVVLSHKLTLEHAAIDINTDRVLYHMELELATPLPPHALHHTQFLALTWPYGGLWKVEQVSADNTRIECLSWRKTDLTPEQVGALATQVDELATAVEKFHTLCDDTMSSDESLPTLFEWKMARGKWRGDANHWFIRDVEPPVLPQPCGRQLIVKLFTGFQALEARIEVNAVTAIDTVAQMYAADVTWQVSLPAITALREDMALREFLDLVEIDAEQFEFTNMTEIHELRDLNSSVTPAGDVRFQDLSLMVDHALVTEPLYHLQFRRRVVASFTEEMALHHFPFDRQKLAFDFSTGSTGMPNEMVRLTPAAVTPGSFSIENFQLGNVFRVAYDSKVFVCELQETGAKKSMSFEMVVERRSAYYLTNVALIAAIITYLCFVTWAPTPTGPMDVSSRLQIVTALVLTAVTFKNQVASLIPQISYFSMLDSYVFVCFMVTCLVTLENAFVFTIEQWLNRGSINEEWLLGFSAGAFTLLNVVWAAYIRVWLLRRRDAARVLHQVHEYVAVISDVIPAVYRKGVLEKYLEQKKYPAWSRPKFITTINGDVHLQAPDDRPEDSHAKVEKRVKRMLAQQQHAQEEAREFKRILTEIRPALDQRLWQRLREHPEVRKEMAVLHVGRMFATRKRRRVSQRRATLGETRQPSGFPLRQDELQGNVRKSHSARVA